MVDSVLAKSVFRAVVVLTHGRRRLEGNGLAEHFLREAVRPHHQRGLGVEVDGLIRSSSV
eukprot:5534247-Alexandrium_andersonii.AAC.1